MYALACLQGMDVQNPAMLDHRSLQVKGHQTASRAAVAAREIGDYAVMGDCRSAALVSRDGSIDWLCLPLFSSASLFGAVLDEDRGGQFGIRPAVPATSTRRYLPGTNVLETTWRANTGCVRLTDAMTLPTETQLQPANEILRLIEGIDGEVPMRVEIDLRPDYGLANARLEARGRQGWAWTWGNQWLHLRTDLPMYENEGRLCADTTLTAGRRYWLSLTYSQHQIGVILGLGAHAQRRLDDTARWWMQWSARARYDGPYRDAVVRSALTLKLLTHALSGAIVAAPSASLPETLGGDRNWDYRYCWLRDAALTMRALTGLGYLDEGRAFLDWLLHATRLTWPRLQVLYDVYGRTNLPERELAHWRGFRESQPVRVGNDAHKQLQLDVYGAVCLAARELVAATGSLQRDEARLLRGFGRVVCERWEQPDSSIWEIRGERRHYTFSKVMCWAAVDALIDLAGQGHMQIPQHFRDLRSTIAECIEARGYNADLRSYIGVLDGNNADASLLLMGCVGYRDPADERMRGTFSFVHQRLACNGLLHRYERSFDRISSPEGAFGICSLWAIDNLARRGDLPEARRRFEHVLRYANDLGLLSEEIDPVSGQLLGNFPQAYTHVGVINAAMALR